MLWTRSVKVLVVLGVALMAASGCGKSTSQMSLVAPSNADAQGLDTSETDAGLDGPDRGEDEVAAPDGGTDTEETDGADPSDGRLDIGDGPGGVDGGGDGGVDSDQPDAPLIAPCAPDARTLATLCSLYCSIVHSTCTGVDMQFESKEVCITGCTRPTWSCGNEGDTSGNSVHCRFGHAAALVGDPTLAPVECPLAGPTSAGCR